MVGLVKEIQRYSSFTVDQFKEPNANEWHRHRIDWLTSSQEGFPQAPDTDEIWTEEAWQFGLGGHPKPASRGHLKTGQLKP
jgi:hypothetical protein